MDALLYWSDEHRIWGSFPALDGWTRYWNAFGTARPSGPGLLEIAVELNLPARGVSRQIQGVFVRDEEQGLTLLHRGRINVGNQGLRKAQILAAFSGDTLEVSGERMLVVAHLGEPDLVGQIARWVREVEAVKASFRKAGPKALHRRTPRPAIAPSPISPPDPERERRLSHLLFR